MKAEKNRRFLATMIALADHPEWAVTVAFYSALHRVEQYLAAGNTHFEGRRDRLEHLRVHLPALYVPFKQLHDASRVARYDPASEFFKKFTSPQDVQSVVIDGWLVAVERYVDPPPPAN